jgi:transcriptional regulator GlxA family with amidase domain
MPSGLFFFLDLIETINSRFEEDKLTPVWVSIEQGSITCAHGMSLSTENSLHDVELDAVLVPGCWGNGNIAELIDIQRTTIESLKKLDTSVAIWSYCTGVAIHAATGRLDNKWATAAWWMESYVREHFKKVIWNTSLPFVHSNGAATSSAANGHILIFQNLIQVKFGDAIAREVSKFMLLPRPYVKHLPFRKVDLVYLHDKLMKKIFIWANRQDAKQITVASLANYLNLTERTLARKVNNAIGQSVSKFIEQVKINQACELLVFTPMNINEISDYLGYTDDSNFRRTFKRLVDTSPKVYREKYKKHTEIIKSEEDKENYNYE